MKIYARQINPECQESPLFICDDFFPDDIAVFGNRDFAEHLPDVVRRVREVLRAGDLDVALYDFIDTEREKEPIYATEAEAVADYLPPESSRGEYTATDVDTIIEGVQAYAAARRIMDENNALCAVLSVVTGQKWACKQLCGDCQSDWNYIYYPVDSWSRAALEGFETEYFNTGTEWIIHDGKDIPEEPDDISGYSVYCTEWNDEGIRSELSSAAGCAPEDVILYKYAGSRSVAIYEKAVI